MNLWEALLIALRGLGVRRLRSALTMLSLITGAAAGAGSDRRRRASECTRCGLHHLIAARPLVLQRHILRCWPAGSPSARADHGL
ncbi:MAG: hypothetical protein ACRDRO_18925, partial [Pseudonocardiaceae bacterium]